LLLKSLSGFLIAPVIRGFNSLKVGDGFMKRNNSFALAGGTLVLFLLSFDYFYYHLTGPQASANRSKPQMFI